MEKYLFIQDELQSANILIKLFVVAFPEVR